MARIVEIDAAQGIVYIAQEDKTLKEVPLEFVKFAAAVGDLVNVYEKTDGGYIVEKIDAPLVKTQAGASEGREIDQMVFIFMALVFGTFGIHKFITGRPWSGVFYLLFCWTGIPTLFSFVEAIVAARKKKNANGNIVAGGFFG